MITKDIYGQLRQAMLSSVACLESRLKRWTRPAKRNQVMSTVSDLKRSKQELIAENMFLRQQLIVLERQVVRPRLTQHDRRVLGLLASRIQSWRFSESDFVQTYDLFFRAVFIYFIIELGDVNRFESVSEMIEAIYRHIHYYDRSHIRTALRMPPAIYAS